MGRIKTQAALNDTPFSAHTEGARILIVDDAAVNRELLRLNLSKYGYSILIASNGRQAIRELQANPDIDLIILDLIMPVMDGFDFLKWRRGNSAAQSVPVIVNSSLDDFDSIASALQMEAYDYFTKPMSQEEMNIILPLKIRNAVQSRRLMAETKRQNEIMRQELEMASRYQKFLLPAKPDLRHVKVAFKFQPCTQVGGDYFDFLPLPDGKVACMVADVTGHGVAAAMTASICKALLPRYLKSHCSPAKALLAINSDLLELTQQDIFVTAFATIYNPADRLLLWSTAGHPPVLYLDGQGNCQRLQNNSPFLGIFEDSDAMLGFEDFPTPMEPGGRLLLYTDGLIEAPDHNGTRYGLGRLERLLLKNHKLGIDDLIETVWQDLAGFVNGDFPDDVAVIVLEF